jgi:hypothetical protein
MPRVSVIIPTYERRGFLDEALVVYRDHSGGKSRPWTTWDVMLLKLRGWWANGADADMTLSVRSA